MEQFLIIATAVLAVGGLLLCAVLFVLAVTGPAGVPSVIVFTLVLTASLLAGHMNLLLRGRLAAPADTNVTER